MKKAQPVSSTNIPQYPHLLNNHPCGIDKFNSQSQCKLVEGISEQIINIDSSNNPYKLARIIGLDGGWGVGKSNVIKQLKSKVGETNYYVFEYDAWGHQEDLQRRSFLESLTRELIDREILTGKVKTTIDGEFKKITWQQKLDDLLARKVVRVNKSIPKFNAGALWTALALACTPFTVFIAERLESASKVDNILWLTLIAFAPILIGLLLWGIFMIKNKEMRSLGYLLKISKEENVETKNYETINEDEPNVFKFKAWMQDISNYIAENNKPRLIVVFDNMDRLPSNKVKELWSSIQTFFSSEEGFDNIWAIIPFDRDHLACAFGDDSRDGAINKELTNHFIEKTFPIVYRVSPPVIIDLKEMFDTLFKEAFGDTENQHQNSVNRLFRLSNSTPTIREIIIFINELVSLKGIWKTDIDLVSMSIYVLNKERILDDPINQILSGSYLSEAEKKIINNDQTLQRNISALVYCLNVNDAEQIPLTTYIKSSLSLKPNYDINKYSGNKHFASLLDDSVRELDIAEIDSTIKGLSLLSTDKFSAKDKGLVDNLWNFLASQRIKQPLTKQEFEEPFKALLLNADSSHKDKIVKYLLAVIRNFKEFNGGAYYIALKQLEQFLLDNSIGIAIQPAVKDVEPLVFVDYVNEAEDDYKRFNLTTAPEKLDEYLTGVSPENISDIHINAIRFVDPQDYPLSQLLDNIKTSIAEGKITVNNFNNVFTLYKLLWKVDEDGALPVQLSPSHLQTLISGYAQQIGNREYLDLVAMAMTNNVSVLPREYSDEDVKYIAENIDYYDDYGSLLVKCTTWNIPLLDRVLKYMIINKKGRFLDPATILPKFLSIKTKLVVSENDLLERLNNWHTLLTEDELNKGNLKSVIPDPKFYNCTSEVDNELTQYINKIAIEALSEISADTIYANRAAYNTDYWWQVIEYLLDTSYLSPLPDNLTELGKRLLKGVGLGEVTLPIVDLYQRIIDSVDGRRTVATIRDARDLFCDGTKPITSALFNFYEDRFRSQANLIEKAGAVVRKILHPIINNQDSLNKILSNPAFYAEVINTAGDEADDFKVAINTKVQSTNDTKLLEFASLIGISQPTTDETTE
ncbi:KAP family NTPase [Alistipes sp. OttesenSCG-928-B03]|nr:KAP family NTPase [Alistipes sp. OttesenSCG-928-B03]